MNCSFNSSTAKRWLSIGMTWSSMNKQKGSVGLSRLADSFSLSRQKTLLPFTIANAMTVIPIMLWKQIELYAHLLLSCYRSNASTLLYRCCFDSFAIISYQKSALPWGMYFFALVVCLGFTSAPLIGMMFLVSIPFYGWTPFLSVLHLADAPTCMRILRDDTFHVLLFLHFPHPWVTQGFPRSCGWQREGDLLLFAVGWHLFLHPHTYFLILFLNSVISKRLIFTMQI